MKEKRPLLRLLAIVLKTSQYFFVICFCFIGVSSFCQDKTGVNFKKVMVSDFNIPFSSIIDSNTKAVVLANIGNSDFEGSSKGTFVLAYNEFKRVLLLKKSAFGEATIEIPIYTGKDEFAEVFENFEASTYNLENGVVIETRFDKNTLFKEKYNKNYTIIKFTFPQIKEGSIIEYRYRIKSTFNRDDIRSWDFQGKYPILWSEYKVTIPPVYNYKILKQGDFAYNIDSVGKMKRNYTVLETSGLAKDVGLIYNITGDAVVEKWVIKNIPGFKTEEYIFSPDNYIPKISFQLYEIHGSKDTIKIEKNWDSTSAILLRDPDFGKSFIEEKPWLQDDMHKLLSDSNEFAKAKKIFEFIRDNFLCTDSNALYLSAPLKSIYEERKGTVADLNILLTALLINQGYDAHPVLLSTREHGKTVEGHAILDQYNYVVSEMNLNGITYLLDASVKKMGFGKLPEKCYNGSAWVIDKNAKQVKLSADSITESKTSMITLENDRDGEMKGSSSADMGYYESLSLRNKFTKNEMKKEIWKSYSSDMEIYNEAIENISNYEEPVSASCDLKLKFSDAIIYFDPLFGQGMKRNPFAADKRLYPVEMPYKTDDTYVLNMEIPSGYSIDEMPKPGRIKLNENDGLFEYLIAVENGKIQLRSRLHLNKTFFAPEEYNSLRDFFAYVVKKQSEQIVFKKKK
ncbi:MAG: DUF3857 domain-containing protein [Bacteroidetes bacterium]|nr:DUF3857 domain-containing protein [Bacteroidota bacterium]